MTFNRSNSSTPKINPRVLFLSLILASIFLVSGILVTPRVYGFANGESAAVVIGYNNFVSRDTVEPPNASTVAGPSGLTFDSSGNLWVADSSNGRVLEFKAPISTGESATVVLGSSVFTQSNSLSSPTQNSLPEPYGLAFDSSGNLWVSDALANRIVEFTTPFTNGENEALVLGQANFTGANNPLNTVTQSDLSAPSGIAFDSSGNLWVADSGNNRVVEFQKPLTMGESESTVIGQTNFTTGVQDIPGCPQSCSASTSATSLNVPKDVAFDSSGNLWVGDTHVGNLAGRVVKYNTPFSNGESASLAIGVTSTNSIPDLSCISGGGNCLGFPDYLAFDKSGNLWINDDTGGRVLEFTQPFSLNQSASLVIGQPNFTATEPNGPVNATQSAFYGADGIAFDSAGNLWVSAGLQNRILEFPSATTGSSSSTSASSVASTTTTATSSSVSTSVTVPTTFVSVSVSQTSTTNSVTSSIVVPPPTTAAAATSSSSSTAISLNYLFVVAVVGIVMVGTLIVFRRRT